jgi:hypothetical protein
MLLKYTWFEEEYECQLAIARIKEQLNILPDLGYSFSTEDIESEYLKAIDIISDRAEAYLRLGILYNRSGQFAKSYEVLHTGKLISLDVTLNKYMLFVIASEYESYFSDELSVACYHLNKKQEGVSLINKVINEPGHAHLKKHYQSNLDHFSKLK